MVQQQTLGSNDGLSSNWAERSWSNLHAMDSFMEMDRVFTSHYFLCRSKALLVFLRHHLNSDIDVKYLLGVRFSQLYSYLCIWYTNSVDIDRLLGYPAPNYPLKFKINEDSETQNLPRPVKYQKRTTKQPRFQSSNEGERSWNFNKIPLCFLACFSVMLLLLS